MRTRPHCPSPPTWLLTIIGTTCGRTTLKSSTATTPKRPRYVHKARSPHCQRPQTAAPKATFEPAKGGKRPGERPSMAMPKAANEALISYLQFIKTNEKNCSLPAADPPARLLGADSQGGRGRHQAVCRPRISPQTLPYFKAYRRLRALRNLGNPWQTDYQRQQWRGPMSWFLRLRKAQQGRRFHVDGQPMRPTQAVKGPKAQIGRASCRERV